MNLRRRISHFEYGRAEYRPWPGSISRYGLDHDQISTNLSGRIQFFFGAFLHHLVVLQPPIRDLNGIAIGLSDIGPHLNADPREYRRRTKRECPNDRRRIPTNIDSLLEGMPSARPSWGQTWTDTRSPCLSNPAGNCSLPCPFTT